MTMAFRHAIKTMALVAALISMDACDGDWMAGRSMFKPACIADDSLDREQALEIDQAGTARLTSIEQHHFDAYRNFHAMHVAEVFPCADVAST